MKVLYIFPHPDDESFGPAAAMWDQLRQGIEVYLLTLTKGGATKQRHRLNLSVEAMGEVRYQEMKQVEKVLGLTEMTVLDLPDGGLQEMDPRELEKIVQAHIERIRPTVLVSYPVHGVSGFHDHLIMHAVVKRVFLTMREQGANYLKRLAFITIPDNGKSVFQEFGFRMKQSPEHLIDCIMPLSEEHIAKLKEALLCYTTYQDTIKEARVIENIGNTLYFEFYGEDCRPPVKSITEGLV